MVQVTACLGEYTQLDFAHQRNTNEFCDDPTYVRSYLLLTYSLFLYIRSIGGARSVTMPYEQSRKISA
jgi:hypothetical protein